MDRTMSGRRYDVDWLRVLAFILLIFYHIGMYYVADWGWHIKSAYQSEFLQNLMLLSNQWRMSLIFLLSGMALSLVEPKIGRSTLLRHRGLRVFLPLVAGMYLITPPQLYFELRQNMGFTSGYAEFFLHYINPNTSLFPEYQYFDTFGLLTWNHLWYLAYLWHYTLVYIFLKPLFCKLGNWLGSRNFSVVWVAAVPVLLMTLSGLLLKPYFPKTNALFDDWYNHSIYFTVFVVGYLIVKSSVTWEKLIQYRSLWITIALAAYSFILLIHHGVIDYSAPSLGRKVIVQIIVYTNVWMWLLAAVGFAGAYLNKPSPVLSYLNDAVLPWYILHQTMIILLAVFLSHFALGGITEPALLIILTFVCCWMCYEFIRRFLLTRILFGMKLKNF